MELGSACLRHGQSGRISRGINGLFMISKQDRKNLDIRRRELPGLEHVSQDSFDDAFDDWAKGYTLRPEELSGTSHHSPPRSDFRSSPC